MAASYPSAVKTFATRSAGQTIDASHVNDLQDEVNAIESGILNGTAPVSASRVTGASLSIAGASTLASLVVSGNSTIVALTAGSVTVTGNSILQTVTTSNATISGEAVIGAAFALNGVGQGTLSQGDQVLGISSAAFFYLQTNSSGSTLTGMSGQGGNNRVMLIFNAGPSAVLGLKNSSVATSTNQFQLANGDTSIGVGQLAMFYYNSVSGRWNKVS